MRGAVPTNWGQSGSPSLLGRENVLFFTIPGIGRPLLLSRIKHRTDS